MDPDVGTRIRYNHTAALYRLVRIDGSLDPAPDVTIRIRYNHTGSRWVWIHVLLTFFKSLLLSGYFIIKFVVDYILPYKIIFQCSITITKRTLKNEFIFLFHVLFWFLSSPSLCQ
jgi:hypothetical protein